MRIEILLLERRKKTQTNSQCNKILLSKHMSSQICKIKSWYYFTQLFFFFLLDCVTFKCFHFDCPFFVYLYNLRLTSTMLVCSKTLCTILTLPLFPHYRMNFDSLLVPCISYLFHVFLYKISLFSLEKNNSKSMHVWSRDKRKI